MIVTRRSGAGFPSFCTHLRSGFVPRRATGRGSSRCRTTCHFFTNLIFHSDVNVNMASTMTLDFAAFDKPIVNVAFDVSNPPLFGRPIWEHYYRYDHYLPVVQLGAARFARSPDDLAADLTDYLGDPGLDREARRRLLDLELGAPMGDSSRRVLDALLEIAA